MPNKTKELREEVAKALLKLANDERLAENDWPAGQEWEDLVASSQSSFLRKAGYVLPVFNQALKQQRREMEDILKLAEEIFKGEDHKFLLRELKKSFNTLNQKQNEK